MSTSRAESQSSQYGRRRSNTAQSIFKNPPQPSISPAKFGDSKNLITWVHDPKESPVVLFNHVWWPGVNEGDILRVTTNNSDSGFLFTVPKDEGMVKPQLQISIPRPIADRFSLRNNGEITVTKVDKNTCRADYVEFTFQDQYLGRNEMWRLCQHLVGECVYVDQDISFIGVIAAKISSIYINGKKVTAGCLTSSTKAIYRSLSAKATVFIQVCREFWEFAGDGECFYEKVVHSFLPALCAKWREAGTNHIVTIVLISRVLYDKSEIGYAAGPLRLDDEGRWYKDFFKVITDLEVIYDWKPTLVSLKDSFWQFQRDILLNHHYHQASLSTSSSKGPMRARLIGQLSFAHDGPILEALNLGLNPTETHYIDRSLSLTGACTIIITPGTGYFRVSKQLLRLTTTRLLDQGFALDLVSLAKPPLHRSPIFCFKGMDPEHKLDKDGKGGYRALDPLWGGDEDPNDFVGKEKTIFWWEPFWMSVSFWDKQMDLPFRQDRFVARAKMHEIQSLGLLDHDVVSSIGVPFLFHSTGDVVHTPMQENIDVFQSLSKADAERFDLDIFSLNRKARSPIASRNSIASSGSGTVMSSSHRSNEKRPTPLSSGSRMIPPIEESPKIIPFDLPQEDLESKFSTITSRGLSSSPSRSSIRSVGSTRSTSTTTSATDTPERKSRKTNSKFAPSWLFNPFRVGISQPQTSAISASSSTSPTGPSAPSTIRSTTISSLTDLKTTIPGTPKPVNIQRRASPRNSTLSRTLEDDNIMPHRSSLTRNSPLGTPPRDEQGSGKRWGAHFGAANVQFSSSLQTRTNPSYPEEPVPYCQSSLARRWQHIFPEPLSKKEIKWKSMVTPACLPLTVEHFPTKTELESSYDVFSYGFVVDPPEMRSFFVKPPSVKGSKEEVRKAWAGAVMRQMIALRLAQGFQFVLRASSTKHSSPSVGEPEKKRFMRQSHGFAIEEDLTPQAEGAADVLSSTSDPVYLSMSNEIHRIAYTGDSIQVRRYVRRMPVSPPIEYQCLIWPKLGVGYTELKTSFVSHGLENYGWNRLDMLIAGYEYQFNESLRYWRTRFVVIPTAEPPLTNIGPTGEKLNDEEIRLVGMDKLAELFSRVRWQSPEEKGNNSLSSTLVRFLPTDLGPSACLLDDMLVNRLEEIHSLGPLKKKIKSERDIGEMTLSAVAKAMREDDGVPIKDYKWHGKKYSDAFTGSDFASWLVREFRDVSSREQAAEVGVRLQAQGLFDHSRGTHGFLDGHYFYQLKGEYATPSTPRGWFRSTRHTEESSGRSGHYPSNTGRLGGLSSRRVKKRLILSQSVVIDVDSNKRSDQAEIVILHHDIIHNPANCFHFELHWIGTTARCIEDQLRQWSRTIERYGLKLVEAYVGQICDIRDHNPFQSCFPVRLAVPPPIVPDLEHRISEGTQAKHYFECTMLRRFGFVLDIEAGDMSSENVEAVYPYRHAPFRYSQWVHRSGVAFVQVLGGAQGFLFLTNRLMGPGRMGTSLKSKEQRTGAPADEIRVRMSQLCGDANALNAFYDEELEMLTQVPEDPPPLRI